MNLQHYREYGIIELVAMVQQEYIDKKEKDQLEKFDGDPEKQGEILDECNKDRQGVEKWKSEKCQVLEDKLNESIQQEYQKALDALIPGSNESR